MDLNALTAKENIRVSCWCYFCLCLRWNYVSLNGYILLNLTFNASFWNFTIFPVFFIRERKFEKLLNILVSRVKWARIIYDIYYWGHDFKQYFFYIYNYIYNSWMVSRIHKSFGTIYWILSIHSWQYMTAI